MAYEKIEESTTKENRTSNFIMPHALSMPAPGFQAIILCGPGSSFPTFTANPDENPKALIPIANRPMVWYPIDFCYRMGVTSELSCAPSKLLLNETSDFDLEI